MWKRSCLNCLPLLLHLLCLLLHLHLVHSRVVFFPAWLTISSTPSEGATRSK
jgi:hypothetical protein